MTERVKPRRRYSSPRRQEQAAQTRADILAAAGSLFRERGYRGTSMPLIASEAGVVVETLYRAFGSKARLFRAVMEAVLAGGGARAETAVEQRPAIKAIIDEPDARRQIERYAATQPGIHRRAGPLLRALASGAASDPELNSLWREMEAWRFSGQSRFVGMLADQGKLRSGLAIERASDIVWTLCSLAVYDLLVLERGWSDDHYRDWLAGSLSRELLPELSASSRRRPQPG